MGWLGWRTGRRPGRPATYTPEVVAEVIATALTKPEALDLPFGSWTLDRLKTYLHEQQAIGMKRSRIDKILVAEGVRWRQQGNLFGERVDPDVAEQRGASLRATPRRPKGAREFAALSWGWRAPSVIVATHWCGHRPGNATTDAINQRSGPMTDAAATATSLGPSARPPGRPTPVPMTAGRSSTGWNS